MMMFRTYRCRVRHGKPSLMVALGLFHRKSICLRSGQERESNLLSLLWQAGVVAMLPQSIAAAAKSTWFVQPILCKFLLQRVAGQTNALIQRTLWVFPGRHQPALFIVSRRSLVLIVLYACSSSKTISVLMMPVLK